MYDRNVKTVTITIPDELDADAAAEARRRGISKSELFRRGLAAVLPERAEESTGDPWDDLAGFGDPSLSTAAGEIDDIVYDS
jgi:hypothetical protein